MPDILLNRETVILTTTSDGLFPRNDLYPSDDLYPAGEVREITNIVAGSLKLDYMLAEKTIQFGQLYATKFEVQVYNEIDLSGRYIYVYQREGNVYHDIFSGIVDSCKVDKVGTDRTIVAYDRAYSIRQLNVADFWNGYWTVEGQTATLGEIRNALLNYYDIAHEEVTLPNDSLTFGKTVEFTSCSFQQFLSCICELNCCLPHFDGNGYLTFIMLDTEATPIDLTGKYEWMNSDFQDYVTQTVTGIQFYDSDDQLKLTYGTTDNAYPVKKNIFLYDAKTEVLNSVGSTMMSYLQDLSYTPASLKMIVGSFDINVGDYVHTEKGDFFVLQNSYSGSQFVEQTIKADGDEQSYGGTEDLDYGEIILNQRYARLSKTMEEFFIEYGDYQDSVASKIDGIFANYTSEDAVDYAPSVSSPPASTWVNPDTRADHIGELFYDTVNKKYYEWQKTGENTYNWVQVPSYAHNYSMVSSRFQINESAISAEVSRATTEEKGIKQDNAEAFANYVGTYVPTSSNTPANSWTTNALKKEHAGEVFYNKTTEKYYAYTLTYNQDGTVSTAQWVQTNINKRYDLVTTTSKAKMDLTSTNFTVSLNSEITARQDADLSATYNYSGNYVPTASNTPASSWTTAALKKEHTGEIFYNTYNKKYYQYIAVVNTSTGAVSGSWVDIGTSNKAFDLVTKSANAKLNLTKDEFSVTLEQSERELFANYEGSGVPGKPWSDADSNHVGEVYYRTDTDKYYIYGKSGNSYSWSLVTDSTKPFKVVSSQIKQTVDDISLKVSKGDVVSEINVSSDAIQLNTAGRLLITAGNFKLDNTGHVTASGATLTGGSLTIENPNYGQSVIDIDYPGADVQYLLDIGAGGMEWNAKYSSLSKYGELTVESATITDATITQANLNGCSITDGIFEVGSEITIGDPFYFKIDSNNKTIEWNMPNSSMTEDGSLYIENGNVACKITSGTSSGSKIEIEDGSITGYYNNNYCASIGLSLSDDKYQLKLKGKNQVVLEENSGTIAYFNTTASRISSDRLDVDGMIVSNSSIIANEFQVMQSGASMSTPGLTGVIPFRMPNGGTGYITVYGGIIISAPTQ